MSYLDFPRLHFAGRFYTNPSTVNNTVTNYQRDVVDPAGQNNPANYNWNPDGDHAWEFRDCTVQSVVYQDGTLCDDPSQDPVVGSPVAATDDPATPRIRGFDPEEQYIAEVWGLTLQVAGGLVQGEYLPVSMTDFWFREPSSEVVEDDPTSAYFQSILHNVGWGNVGRSRFLEELRSVSPETLSIKFMVDGFYGKAYVDDPNYLTGRVVGTVGPYWDGEPLHFHNGRWLRPLFDLAQWQGQTIQVWDGAFGCYFAPFRVDEERGLVLVDLGNSLPRTQLGNASQDLGDLSLIVGSGPEAEVLGMVEYQTPPGGPDPYEHHALIQQIPVTPEQIARIRYQPLGIRSLDQEQTSFTEQLLLAEDVYGRFLRADTWIYRLNPGDIAEVDFYATRFGEPAAGVTLDLALDDDKILQWQLVGSGDPPIGTPASAIQLAMSVTTDEAGHAVARIPVRDPGTPRYGDLAAPGSGFSLGGSLDGQIYGIWYQWRGGTNNPSPQAALLIRVFSAVSNIPNPTWEHVGPILGQYGKLYPKMTQILDIGNPATYQDPANIQAVQQALSYPESDPRYMPISRDLSQPRRDLLLLWLEAGAPMG